MSIFTRSPRVTTSGFEHVNTSKATRLLQGMFLVPSARHKNTLRFSVWSLRAWVLAWRALSSPDLDGRCRPEIFASEKRARPQRALRTQRPLALAWPGAREMHAWRVSSSSKYRQLMLWRARIAAALVSMPTWWAQQSARGPIHSGRALRASGAGGCSACRLGWFN